MDTPINLDTDMLADANLTQEQLHYWHLVREELRDSRLMIQELEVQIKNLQKQASEQDPYERSILTRPEFNREVARMLAFDERYGGVSSVLYFDFDNLPDITKTLGNTTTKEIIHIICETLSKAIRTSDIVGRLAPNEFGILLVRCDNANAWMKAESLAAKLRSVLPTFPNHSIAISISYGAYTFRENEDAAGGLKEAAKSVTHAPNKA